MARGNFRMKAIDLDRLKDWSEKMLCHAYDRSNGEKPPFVVGAASEDRGDLYRRLVDAQVDSKGGIAIEVNRTTDGVDPTGDLVTMTLGSFLWLIENFVSVDQVVLYADRQEFIEDLENAGAVA